MTPPFAVSVAFVTIIVVAELYLLQPWNLETRLPDANAIVMSQAHEHISSTTKPLPVKKHKSAAQLDMPPASITGTTWINVSNGHVTTLSGLVFDVPQGWQIASSSASYDGYSVYTLAKSTSTTTISIECPPIARGYEGWSISLRSKRTFWHAGLEYSVSTYKMDPDLGAATTTESGIRAFIASFVDPASATYPNNDSKCLSNVPPEFEDISDQIALSWR